MLSLGAHATTYRRPCCWQRAIDPGYNGTVAAKVGDNKNRHNVKRTLEQQKVELLFPEKKKKRYCNAEV
jgi:hypothetical protein